MTALSVAGAIVGLALAIVASRRAVLWAASLALGFGVSPFIVGVALIAIGTDLPEMANSISAALSGHGDVGAGDAIGSTVTQLTLVLGILPFVAGSFVVGKSRALTAGLWTVGALILLAPIVADGSITRWEAAGLIGVFAVAMAMVIRYRPIGAEPAMTVRPQRSLRLVVYTLGALLVVAAGATLAVTSVVVLAERFEVPEFMISFFALAIGTSLPELVVELTALRLGQRDLAVGDAFGSSLVDATLSLAVGPLILPTTVTAPLVLRSIAVAAPIVLAVTLVLAWRRRHDWKTGLFLVALYGLFFPILLAA